jgi:hypothetical protein
MVWILAGIFPAAKGAVLRLEGKLGGSPGAIIKTYSLEIRAG